MNNKYFKKDDFIFKVSVTKKVKYIDFGFYVKINGKVVFK